MHHAHATRAAPSTDRADTKSPDDLMPFAEAIDAQAPDVLDCLHASAADPAELGVQFAYLQDELVRRLCRLLADVFGGRNG